MLVVSKSCDQYLKGLRISSSKIGYMIYALLNLVKSSGRSLYILLIVP